MSAHEVRIDGFEHNMAEWMAEKAAEITRDLALSVESVAALNPAPLFGAARLRFDFRSALWNSTKLWAAACGATWTTEDADLVLNQGYAGLEKLGIRYGRPVRPKTPWAVEE